jgi:hypothetical protein
LRIETLGEISSKGNPVDAQVVAVDIIRGKPE